MDVENGTAKSGQDVHVHVIGCNDWSWNSKHYLCARYYHLPIIIRSRAEGTIIMLAAS